METDAREILLARLQEATTAGQGKPVIFTDDSLPPPPSVVCHTVSRLHISLAGSHHLQACQLGTPTLIQPETGQWVYSTPFGWTRPLWNLPTRTIGVVCYEAFTRFLYFEDEGTTPRLGGPDLFYHTSSSLPLDAVHLIKALDVMARTGRRSAAVGTELVTALACMLADELQKTAPTIDPSQRLWQDMVAYMAEHAHEPMDRSSLAAHFRIHPNSLSRLFHLHDPMTFQEHLTHLRLMRSCRLLHHADLSIEDVARASGFANSNYYIKVFRKAYNQTPGHYRAQN